MWESTAALGIGVDEERKCARVEWLSRWRAMMRGIRTSYIAAVMIVWCLNGWAVLQQMAIIPAIEGFVAATLLIDMLAAPLLLWIAFVYGELAEEEILRRKRGKGAKERHAQ
jgi:hypothetical protein